MNKNLMNPPEKKGAFRNLMDAAFPRVSALNGRVAPWSARAGIASLADLASLPGRAYVSIGRPEGESYVSALGRTEPRYDMAGYQGEGDELAETILRDPTLLLGIGLGRIASGLGKLGGAAVDALGNAGMTAGSQYATSGQVDPLAVAIAAGLGAAPHAMPSKAPVSRMASEITPEQRAENFKNWFGDSKVVDEYGNPLVVYHGTSSDFAAFDPSQAGRTYQADKRGIFFSEDPDQAHNAAIDSHFSVGGSESIMPTNLRVEQPYSPDLTTQQFDEADKAKIFLAAKRAGADGIRLKDGTWVVLDPTQIKSATGNRGTFDPNDPNITHFAGSAPTSLQSTPIQALGNRLSAGAKQAVFRNLMGDSQNRSDTYYTKGGSR